MAAARGGDAMEAAPEFDIKELTAFCQKWRVRELSLFGSALRDDFGPDSDLDFVVRFEPDVSLRLDDILDMKDELQEQYGRQVDLIEFDALRNPWRIREILRTRKVLYAE
jgi:hypothetical protein